MISVSIYIFSAFLSLFSASYHPVHVSVMNMEYVKEKSTIDISCKVFTADLELAIAHNYNVVLNLGQTTENPEAIKHINKYLTTTFRLLINNKYQLPIVTLKKETIDDATWLHASLPLNDSIQTIKFHNAILMDIYEDQTNLMIVSLNNKETGLRFGFYNREIELKN